MLVHVNPSHWHWLDACHEHLLHLLLGWNSGRFVLDPIGPSCFWWCPTVAASPWSLSHIAQLPSALGVSSFLVVPLRHEARELLLQLLADSLNVVCSWSSLLRSLPLPPLSASSLTSPSLLQHLVGFLLRLPLLSTAVFELPVVVVEMVSAPSSSMKLLAPPRVPQGYSQDWKSCPPSWLDLLAQVLHVVMSSMPLISPHPLASSPLLWSMLSSSSATHLHHLLVL